MSSWKTVSFSRMNSLNIPYLCRLFYDAVSTTQLPIL